MAENIFKLLVNIKGKSKPRARRAVLNAEKRVKNALEGMNYNLITIPTTVDDFVPLKMNNNEKPIFKVMVGVSGKSSSRSKNSIEKFEEKVRNQTEGQFWVVPVKMSNREGSDIIFIDPSDKSQDYISSGEEYIQSNPISENPTIPTVEAGGEEYEDTSAKESSEPSYRFEVPEGLMSEQEKDEKERKRKKGIDKTCDWIADLLKSSMARDKKGESGYKNALESHYAIVRPYFKGIVVTEKRTSVSFTLTENDDGFNVKKSDSNILFNANHNLCREAGKAWERLTSKMEPIDIDDGKRYSENEWKNNLMETLSTLLERGDPSRTSITNQTETIFSSIFVGGVIVKDGLKIGPLNIEFKGDESSRWVRVVDGIGGNDYKITKTFLAPNTSFKEMEEIAMDPESLDKCLIYTVVSNDGEEPDTIERKFNEHDLQITGFLKRLEKKALAEDFMRTPFHELGRRLGKKGGWWNNQK